VAKQESLDAERRNKEKEVRDLESSIARREAAKRERAEAEAKEAERSAQSAFNAEQECVTTLRRNFIRGDQTTSNPLQRFFQQPE
jgi:septal ring factor EnvC (AmiA/AmiB activator)